MPQIHLGGCAWVVPKIAYAGPQTHYDYDAHVDADMLRWITWYDAASPLYGLRCCKNAY